MENEFWGICILLFNGICATIYVKLLMNKGLLHLAQTVQRLKVAKAMLTKYLSNLKKITGILIQERRI
jgi:hypothetical protein